MERRAVTMPSPWKKLVSPLRTSADQQIPFDNTDPAKGRAVLHVDTDAAGDDLVAVLADAWHADLARYMYRKREQTATAFVVDDWVERFGIAATMQACVAVAAAERPRYGAPQLDFAIERLVRHVAACSPADWAELDDQWRSVEIAPLRELVPLVQCFPGRVDLVDSALSTIDPGLLWPFREQLWQAVTTEAHINAMMAATPRLVPGKQALATLLDRFGHDLLPFLATWSQTTSYSQSKDVGKDLAAALAAIGSAEALRVLFVHADRMSTFATAFRAKANENPEIAVAALEAVVDGEHGERARAELAAFASAEADDTEDSDAASLPELLRTPPWERPTAIKVPRKEWNWGERTVDHVPARRQKTPAYILPGSLTRPKTRDGGRVPAASIDDLITILINGDPAASQLLGELDVSSSAAFLRDLFQAWVEAGLAKNGDWIMRAQRFGDDATVAMLASCIKTWPAQGKTVKAKNAARAMADIGSESAINTLTSLSRSIRSKDVRRSIDYNLDRLADEAGLTREQLADQYVPDFGLGSNGTIELNLGNDQVTVSLDHELRPVIRGADGKIRRSFPKPPADKDGNVTERGSYATAKGVFTRLRKDVKAVAALQIARMESAMVEERRWLARDFRSRFVEHGLLISLTRRFVWGVYDDRGEVTQTFRVAEDATYADAADQTVEVADTAVVGLVHPAALAVADRSRWAQLIDDYELLQPFDQLGREVHLMTDAEMAATDFSRFSDGREHEVYALLGLEKLGWVRGNQSEAYFAELRKPLDGDRYVSLTVDGDGIYAPHPPSSKPSSIASVRLSTDEPFSSLTGVGRSELIRDLNRVFAHEAH